MKYHTYSIFILLILLTSCKTDKTKTPTLNTSDWTILFNGDNLEGWDTYLGMPFVEGQNIWDQKNLDDFDPFGLNNDPLRVFSVVEIDGEPAMRLSGEVFGGISTHEEYGDYHLQLQFKWGNKKHAPKLNAAMDSGILYHGKDEQGTEAGFWLRSQELQIQEHDTGDFWGVAGGTFDIRTSITENENYQYDPRGDLRTFGEGQEIGRHAKKYPDAENPTGQWNTIDLYCLGDKSVHIVNGVITMILENSTLFVEGVSTPLVNGKIQLQTEGAEIFYRDIKIKNIDVLPSSIGDVSI